MPTAGNVQFTRISVPVDSGGGGDIVKNARSQDVVDRLCRSWKWMREGKWNINVLAYEYGM